MPKPDGETRTDIQRLAEAVEVLNEQRVMRIYNSTWRMLSFQFMRGLAFGFGTVIGASALVSVVVLVLSQFEFIPIFGGWLGQIIEEIEGSRGLR